MGGGGGEKEKQENERQHAGLQGGRKGEIPSQSKGATYLKKTYSRIEKSETAGNADSRLGAKKWGDREPSYEIETKKILVAIWRPEGAEQKRNRPGA